MELVISQFWSSGVGSHEPAVVDFEVTDLIMFFYCHFLLSTIGFYFFSSNASNILILYLQIAFHGIDVSTDEVVLDGSEAPVRLEAQALLSSEKLAPTANLNKVTTESIILSYVLVLEVEKWVGYVGWVMGQNW